MNERDAVLALSPEAGAWERLRRGRAADAPVRRGRHRGGRSTGAVDARRRARRAGRPAARDRRGPHPGRTGSPTSSPPPLGSQQSERRSAERARRARRRDGRPARASSSGRVGRAHRDLHGVTPAGGQAVERVEGRQVADVVADVGHRGQPLGALLDHRALVDGHRRVELERHLGGPHVQPRRGPPPRAPRSTAASSAVGHPAEVQRERQALVLHVDARTAPIASTAAAATSSTTGRQRPASAALADARRRSRASRP